MGDVPAQPASSSPAPRLYTARHVGLRRAANWLNLSTPIGLGLARLSGATVERGPHGILVARGRPLRFLAPRAMAVTIGDVVLLRASDDALRRHPHLLDHEARHAAQFALWIGPLGFLPAYLLCAVWSWWRVRDFALRNPFEMRAGLVEGGYVRAPER